MTGDREPAVVQAYAYTQGEKLPSPSIAFVIILF